MIKQGFIIVYMLFLGQILSRWTSPFLSASIVGLLLLFLLLYIKVVKQEDIDSFCTFVIRYMPVLFVVPAVGIIDYFDVIGANLLEILLPLAVSFLAGLYVTAKVTELCIRRREGK